MKNDIKEDYVTFEVAKLLKEKGFDINCEWYFLIKDKTKGVEGNIKIGTICYKTGSMVDNLHFEDNNYAYRPTTALAIKWIRENFKINIEIIITPSKPLVKWFAQIVNNWDITHIASGNFTYFTNTKQIDNEFNSYTSPEEAENAAILYTLKHLIN